MSEIVQGNIGPEAKYDVSFSKGSLVVSVSYQGQQAGASLNLNVSAAALIDALAQKVTNQTEKTLLTTLEAIITAVP